MKWERVPVMKDDVSFHLSPTTLVSCSKGDLTWQPFTTKYGSMHQ
jgi:hypothetical protein